MSHSHKRYADEDATTESLLLITKKLDRQGVAIAELKGDVKELKTGQAEQGVAIAELRGSVAGLQGSAGRIEEMLAKLLDGQAVLHQNDMELKRRLDERK